MEDDILQDSLQDEDSVNPDEQIDYALVYALHTFVANLEGQVCVLKGDSLELLDDSNSYWWLVKCIKTDEIGYIPAENVETPYERLARLNRQKNIELSAPSALELESDDFDDQYATKKPNTRGVNVIFSENKTEIYEDESDDDEDTAVSSNASFEPPVSPGPNSIKPSAVVGGKPKKNIFQRLLGAYSRKEKDRPQQEQFVEKPFVGGNNTNEEVLQKVDDQEPINVLRIYAGNVDLKATFKTVALTKSMTVDELLAAALRRFRVPESSIGEYYVGVLHMDSQEKRLNGTDSVFELLDNLRTKHLPGVRESRVSRAVGKQGRISSVRVNDDNIIRFIVNKELNIMVDKDFHLIRVILFDERDPTGKIRTYKTIGVSKAMSVEDIVNTAVKKFQLLMDDPNVRYTLCTRIRKQDIPRQPHENIFDILSYAEQSNEDLEFVLKHEYISTTSSQSPHFYEFDDTSSSHLQRQQMRHSTPSDLESILQSKPSFLEEFPTNIGVSSMSDHLSVSTTPVSAEIREFESDRNSGSGIGASGVYDESPWHKNSSQLDSIYNQMATSLSNTGLNNSNFNTSNVSSGNKDSGDASGGNSSSNPLKANFQFMEAYLEEIMKVDADAEKVEALEAALKQQTVTSTTSNASNNNNVNSNNSGITTTTPIPTPAKSPVQPQVQLPQLPPTPPPTAALNNRVSTLSDYHDHGLGEILAPVSATIQQPSQQPNSMTMTESNNSGKEHQSSRSSRLSFRDLYLELEADLDKSMSMVPKRDGDLVGTQQQIQDEYASIQNAQSVQSKRVSVMSMLSNPSLSRIPQVQQGMLGVMSGLHNNGSSTSIGSIRRELSEGNNNSMSTSMSQSGKTGANKAVKSDLRLMTSSGLDGYGEKSVDSAIILESFSESEAIIGNLQKELDNLAAVA
ncbi:hypothetical protein HK098_006885, partial [Nowakowskiella sp. JEL0407]